MIIGSILLYLLLGIFFSVSYIKYEYAASPAESFFILMLWPLGLVMSLWIVFHEWVQDL